MAKKTSSRASKFNCSNCGAPFHFQMHRSWIMKQVSLVFPVKKYFCAKCKKSSYVFIGKGTDGE